MLGRVWDGYRKLLDAQVDGNRRAAVDAVAEMQKSLAAYGNILSSGELGRGPAGSLSTAPNRPEREFSSSLDTNALPGDINVAAAEMWEGRQKTTDRIALTRDVASSTSKTTAAMTPADLSAINRRFWAARATPPPSKQWGKG